MPSFRARHSDTCNRIATSRRALRLEWPDHGRIDWLAGSLVFDEIINSHRSLICRPSLFGWTSTTEP